MNKKVTSKRGNKLLVPAALVSIVVIVLVGIFYWYEFRPAWIRHECSLVKKHVDAVPERLALSIDELKARGMIKECPTPLPIRSRRIDGVPTFEGIFDSYCEESNTSKIEEYRQTKPAEPARDWYEKASDEEYAFCIRSRGLTK